MSGLPSDRLATLNADRRDNGEFGEHQRPASEATLNTSRFTDPTSPLPVSVELFERGERDWMRVGEASFDARTVFDAITLTQMSEYVRQGNLEWVLDDARAMGLTNRSASRCTVTLPADFVDYLSFRRDTGQETVPGAWLAKIDALNATKRAERRDVLIQQSYVLAEARGTEWKKAPDLQPGDVLVQGEYRLHVDANHVFDDRGRRVIETPFGELHVTDDTEFTVEVE